MCKLLAATGVAGNPDSYFHRPSISDWLADLGVTREGSVPERELLEAIFRTAITKGALDTGIFGLRLQRHSFDYFIEKLAAFIQSIRATSSVSRPLSGERSLCI